MGYKEKFGKEEKPESKPLKGFYLTIQGEEDGSFALPYEIPFQVNGIEVVRATAKGKPYVVARIVPHQNFRVLVDDVEQVIRPFVVNLFLADPPTS